MDARLEPYRTLVSFLGEALGPDYEVVLHDLTSEEGTIAAIVNNNISGRTEGAPLSNMALRFIHGKVYEKQPYVAGYQGASQAKGRLRSSTMFIKDGSELIGMLCINFDAAKYSRMAQELLSLCDVFHLQIPLRQNCQQKQNSHTHLGQQYSFHIVLSAAGHILL